MTDFLTLDRITLSYDGPDGLIPVVSNLSLNLEKGSIGCLLGASGCGKTTVLRAIAAAALLVFVDTMKELPATLLLRPVNFETLATWLYAEAARGTYEEGAVAALAIVIAGLIPVVLLARAQFKTER